MHSWSTVTQCEEGWRGGSLKLACMHRTGDTRRDERSGSEAAEAIEAPTHRAQMSGRRLRKSAPNDAVDRAATCRRVNPRDMSSLRRQDPTDVKTLHSLHRVFHSLHRGFHRGFHRVFHRVHRVRRVPRRLRRRLPRQIKRPLTLRTRTTTPFPRSCGGRLLLSSGARSS